MKVFSSNSSLGICLNKSFNASLLKEIIIRVLDYFGPNPTSTII